MPPQGLDTSAITESFRRRVGQAPSSAGIPGGAPAANEVTSTNPLASFALQNRQQNVPQAGGASMSQPGIDQLGKTQTGEAEIILKAMAQRLRDLPPHKPQTPGAPSNVGNSVPGSI